MNVEVRTRMSYLLSGQLFRRWHIGDQSNCFFGPVVVVVVGVFVVIIFSKY